MYRLIYISLFLLVGGFSQSYAQNIVIEAIEIGVVGQTGESNLPSSSSFLGSTKNPSLFRTTIASELSRDNSISKTGFRIDFFFKSTQNPKHQFLGGIETSSISYDLYSLNGFFQDTLTATTRYESRNEYFFLKAGYNYVHTPDKRFTFMLGGVLNFGIPVSAKTDEVILVNGQGERSFDFFGKQAPSLGLTVPIGIRLKVLRNISFSLVSRQSLQYHRVDGTPLYSRFQGVNLGFHFKIRES